MTDPRPLVVHVMYRFDTGGLENGVVNLINHMQPEAYRHAVLALTEVTEFSKRITRSDVEFVSLQKPPGHGVWQYPKLFRLFRQMKPAIVHSRNLAALEIQVPAWAAGVPVRIHGEHGRDVGDLDGSNVRYQRMRRLYKPFVHHYVALSRDLADYLVDKVHVPRQSMTQAYNGVDTDHFTPFSTGGPTNIAGCSFDPAQHWLIGTVGRMQTVKDQVMLAKAFVQALNDAPALRQRLRLVMAGDGPLRAQAMAILERAGVGQLAWLPGECNNIADIMRGLHAFALPSLAEGISNTILEAMASALPVVATSVGGNAELVLHGQTGYIVPPADHRPMAQRIIELATDPLLAREMGMKGRHRALSSFSMQAMVETYKTVYDQQMRRVSPNQQNMQ